VLAVDEVAKGQVLVLVLVLVVVVLCILTKRPSC
jgi:hypothetical protein